MLYALSGQHYSAPEQSLSLAPRLASPYELPVLTPGTAMRLTSTSHRVCTLAVLAGVPISLARLSVHGKAPAAGQLPRSLAKGAEITWAC